MASQLYTDYKESCLGGGAHSFADLTQAGADTIKVAVVNGVTDYSFSAAHQDFADIADYLATTPQTLGAKTVTNGVFDNTADITFTSVAVDGAKVIDVLIHYKDSGTPATSPLICYHDAFTPVTPNGGNIVIQYNGSGIFEL